VRVASQAEKVALYALIRRESRAGLSARAIERKHRVSRRTVAAALASAWPEPRKRLRPRGSRLDPFKPVIDEMLRADLDAPRKQRHTGRRVHSRLVREAGADGISYQMVQAYVAERRPQIEAESGRGPSRAFVPQSHQPGAEAEVDFGEVAVMLAGRMVTCYLFSLRLSYSGRAIHRVSTSGGQEAFLEGHVHAFSVLGGVPFRHIRYDNLKCAVATVLGLTRARTEVPKWTAFRSHYCFEAFYCQPGREGAHEKGGVEGDIGWFRRNYLVPVPEVTSLAELNASIGQWDAESDSRRIGGRARTVAESFAAEQPLLRALPGEPFETSLLLTGRVDRYAQVTVRTNRYSVPARLIGRRVRIVASASEIAVYDGQAEVARHVRIPGKLQSSLDLDHYLEVLIRKPGALPGATALEQARAAGKFTTVHDAWWAAACKAHGDAAGTRALIDVLLLARHMNTGHITAGLTAALRAGALTADAVALEARKAAQDDQHASPAAGLGDPGDPAGAAAATVTFLTERRLAHLPADTRPLPTVTAYDQLLRLRSSGGDTP
jgi:transposase